MPAFTSYDNLKTNIADYLARSDLNDKIPMFVALAENCLLYTSPSPRDRG